MAVFIYSSFVFGAVEESETRRTERWRCSFKLSETRRTGSFVFGAVEESETRRTER